MSLRVYEENPTVEGETSSHSEVSVLDPIQLPEISSQLKELFQQWCSYQQSLQLYFKKFHPDKTVVDTQPLPSPQSADDALGQEELYRQWMSYMEGCHTLKSNMERLQRQQTALKGHGHAGGNSMNI